MSCSLGRANKRVEMPLYVLLQVSGYTPSEIHKDITLAQEAFVRFFKEDLLALNNHLKRNSIFENLGVETRLNFLIHSIQQVRYLMPNVI